LLPDPQIQLPEAQLGEWSAIDTRTSTGLFAYRSMQASGLLNLPDFGGGDLTAEQRWTASTSMAGKTTFILAGWLGMNVVV
jgi:hypothetical protein